VQFDKSRHVIKGFEIDGYCEELNLAFEYNGEQHYKEHKIWHREKTLEDQKKRDAKLKRLCKKSNINLISIH